MHAIPRAHEHTDPPTVPDAALSQPPKPRGRHLPVSRGFPASAPPLWEARQPAAAVPVQGMVDATRVLVSLPARRCSAEPDSPARPSPTASPAADWDLLFRSVLACLERVAVERPAPMGTGRQLQAPTGTVLRECLAALDQLRQSMPTEPR